MTEVAMSIQPAAPSHESNAFICKKCSGSMRLVRVDPYPMPRGRIEILILECIACRATLQQVQAKTSHA
jgi:hypothetical protein